MKSRFMALVVSCLFPLFFPLPAMPEPLRVVIAGTAGMSLNNPDGVSIPLSYIDSAVIFLEGDARFFRGIELEFTAPQTYFAYRGSLALAIYAELDRVPEPGVADVQARQINLEPIPNKIQSIYQIPLRQTHGLRTTPYVSVLSTVTLPSSFPLLFRVMPVVKGLNEEIETLRFTLNVKPLLSNEGAVKITLRYPENLPDKAFTLLIDDAVIEKPQEERLLREGEHHLVILSNDYRNENRVFLVERGKILDLTIHLQDPTPLVIFEAPENAQIYFDNQRVEPAGPMPVEPGAHEVKFLLSDYAIVKPLIVQKGKTYRVAMAVDVLVSESD